MGVWGGGGRRGLRYEAGPIFAGATALIKSHMKFTKKKINWGARGRRRCRGGRGGGEGERKRAAERKWESSRTGLGAGDDFSRG